MVAKEAVQQGASNVQVKWMPKCFLGEYYKSFKDTARTPVLLMLRSFGGNPKCPC
jgi:ABC-type transporter MlaC component